MKKIYITGANEFVGKSLCNALISSNNSIIVLARKINSSFNSLKIEYIQIGDISLDINLKVYLVGYDCVVHCAGKAHTMNDRDNLDVYQSANIVGTKNLAEQADLTGLKTPSFIHSIRFVDYLTIISRRLFSFLGCSKIKNTFGIDPSN